MNILGFVFSLLLILSYGFFSIWEKQVGSFKLRKTYIGHENSNRNILNRYQSQIYANLRSKKNPPPPESKLKKDRKITKLKEEEKVENLNPVCSKINLWPLIQEGKTAHPLLYELAAKMIRIFYEPLQKNEKRFEYHLLDAILISAKDAAQNDEIFALEKINLKDPSMQRSYYKMLKGTKRWNLALKEGYPTILDYVKADKTTDKLCIFHAHTDLITVLFNHEIATKLHEEIHKENAPLLTQELLERLCSESHLTSVDSNIFELLEFGRPDHEENKKAFIAEDKGSDVCLRKTLYLKG